MEIEAYCPQCQAVRHCKKTEIGRSWVYTCLSCHNCWAIDCYGSRSEFSARMHHVAVAKIYPLVWSSEEYTLREVANDPSNLARTFDIAGIDTLLVSRNDGHIVGLGERFREHNVWTYQDRHGNYRRRDFTIREAEMTRHIAALEAGGLIPKHYLYGYATRDERDFVALFIVQYRDWLQGIGETHHPHLLRRRDGNESFWYESWNDMPNEYIFNTYHGRISGCIQ